MTVAFAAADDLAIPGIRVPFTANPDLFETAVELGRRLLWLHTYGQRFADSGAGRPPGAPRLPADQAPKVLAAHPIPADAAAMPDELLLSVGDGRIGPVPPAVWEYSVGNKRILTQWFSYRRKDRERPTMGGRRNSPLSKIQPDHWLTEYTTDLIDLLHILALLTETHPAQADLLKQVVDHRKFITVTDLTTVGVLPVHPMTERTLANPPQQRSQPTQTPSSADALGK